MNATATRAERSALPAVGFEVLLSLHQHRLLSTSQIHTLHMPGHSLRWTQRVLARLAGNGLAGRAIGPSRLFIWFLTARGAETIDAAGTLAETRRRLSSEAQ